MKTNYVYGQPSLLVKQCFRSSWYAMHGNEPTDDDIHKEQKRLKGSFIERLFINENYIQTVLSNKKRTWKNIDNFICMLITSCFTTRKTVISKLKYILDEPENIRIKEDIDNMVFNTLMNSEWKENMSTVTAYKANWDKNYNKIIETYKKIAYANWKDGLPSTKVMKMFPNGFIYGKRDTSCRKWHWMENKTPSEIAEYMVDNYITEVDSKTKEALKYKKISVKEVKISLTECISKIEPDDLKLMPIKREVTKWFISLDERQKNDVLGCIKTWFDKESNYTTYFSLMTAYGYKKEWIVNKHILLSKVIKKEYDLLYPEKKG